MSHIYAHSLYNQNPHWQNICQFENKMSAENFGVFSPLQNTFQFL